MRPFQVATGVVKHQKPHYSFWKNGGTAEERLCGQTSFGPPNPPLVLKKIAVILDWGAFWPLLGPLMRTDCTQDRFLLPCGSNLALFELPHHCHSYHPQSTSGLVNL